MSSLLDRMKSVSTIKMSNVLSKSAFFTDKDQTPTQFPILNVALSGRIDGGLSSGITVLAGPSKHFKSLAGLVLVQAYMQRYPEAVCLFYDSEFGITPDYIAANGIDTERVLHIPIEHIEQLKFDMVKRLEEINRGDKVIVFMDSVGNLASKKEVEDANDGKSVADMSRAKQMKSLFRIITPHFTTKDIPCVVVNHIYMEQGLYPRAIMSGGCLVKGSLLQTPTGLVAIEDFAVGDSVLTMNGIRAVTHTWNPDTLEVGEPECIEVEFEDALTVTCSENHPFLVNGAWVPAADLVVGAPVTVLAEMQAGKDVKIKSLTRVGKKQVFDISVDEAEHYALENGAVTHNTGIMYSSDTVIFFGKSQEKDGTELAGWTFTMNIEKSRRAKEKSRLPFTVMFEGGIQKWSGMLAIALELGWVKKPSNGWYSRVDQETGEIEARKFREKDTHTDEFWQPLITNSAFGDAVAARYSIGTGKLIVSEVDPAAILAD